MIVKLDYVRKVSLFTMSGNMILRNLLAIILLGAGAIFVYAPDTVAFLLEQKVLHATSQQTYIADLDFWQRTDREMEVTTDRYFDLAHNLNEIPLTVGDWKGQDVPETNQEVMILLEPEQYIQRLYQNSAGQYVWLSMIGGRSSQPFHAPDICYDADGWHYNLGSSPITLANGGNLYGLWLEAKKPIPNSTEFKEHVVFYFYLFPNAQRDLADGIVLFKLTSGRYGTVEETLAIHADFVRTLFFSAQEQQ